MAYRISLCRAICGHFFLAFTMHRIHPPLLYSAPIEAISNEANERCKPLCYTAIRRVPRSAYSHGPKTPTPPLCRYIREHPSSPEFFFNFFFWIFMFLQCCDILCSSLGFLCKIILFIALIMLAFALASRYAACV